MKITSVRRITVACGVLLVVVGLAFHTGSGTVSSFGWQQIAAICPLGALETFFAEKMLIPRTVVAFVLMAAGVVLLGKVFCAWLCPLPPLRRFLTPQKKREKEAARLAEERSLVEAQLPAAPAAARALEEGAEAAAPAAPGESAPSPQQAEGDAECKPALPALGAQAASAAQAAMTPQTALAAQAAQPEQTGQSCAKAASCAESQGTGGCSGCKEKRRKLDSRHIVLGGALVSTAIFGFPVFCLVCPVGLTFATIIALWRLVGFSEPSWSLLVFPAVLLVEIVVLRKWCHKLCPLGAMLSLLSLPNRILKPKVDASKCIRAQGGNCHICADACEELLDPHSSDGMHECTKCGVCKEQCPTGAISFALLPKRMR